MCGGTLLFNDLNPQGDKQTVTKLVKEYPHLVDSAETLISGNRGLHEAVMNGRTEICNVLLKGSFLFFFKE